MRLQRLGAVALAGVLLCSSPAWAGPEQKTSAAQPAKARSSGKRVMWTAIGAGAGFAVGMMLGLNAFDDSVNSDRKVWTAALVGAAGGGIAGALLSRSTRRDPATTTGGTVQRQAEPVAVSWSSALGRELVEATALRIIPDAASHSR